MKVTQADGKVIEVDIFFTKKATKGRPRKILTDEALKLIENLSRIMCTEEEISQCLDTELNTLKNEDNKELFESAIKKGRSQGKQSLRRKQWEMANRGSVTMLIWLGKQWLNQTDKVEATTSFEDMQTLADKLKFTPEEIEILKGDKK